MATKKLGLQTVALANPPAIIGHANVVGKKEGDGPLANSFDHIEQDDTFGEKTWEKSETAMQKLALSMALDKAGQAISNLDYLSASVPASRSGGRMSPSLASMEPAPLWEKASLWPL